MPRGTLRAYQLVTLNMVCARCSACAQCTPLLTYLPTVINHGAFGGVCKPAHQEAQRWREHAESQPLQFLDRQLFPQLVRVIREMAAYVGARPQVCICVRPVEDALRTGG